MIYDLNTIIRQKIEHNRGRINFAEFMQLALYHPQFGYYCRDNFQLGKHGDFTTAPEISPLFAECLGQFAADSFSHVNDHNILEIGAGSGRLAHDLLKTLKQRDIQANYFIYEISPSLRKQQQTLLADYRVTWLDNLPVNFSGLIIGNEVLDALPVKLFQIEDGIAKERCISWNGSEYCWILCDDTSNFDLKLPEGYHSELHSELAVFIKNITNCLANGLILFIDYGYGQNEYYHPQRNQGTLTCFHQHRKHSDPLTHIGQQDITSHVNYTLVAETATENACEVLGFTTQAAFLLECGLIDLAQEKSVHLDSVQQFSLNQTIKILTMPSEMGEVVKVIALGKGINFKPKGFHTLDRRRDL